MSRISYPQKDSSENFCCPYCGAHSMVTPVTTSFNWYSKEYKNKGCNTKQLLIRVITCINDKCFKDIITAELCVGTTVDNRFVDSQSRESSKDIVEPKNYNLEPGSLRKILPDGIPEEITKDYYESCDIINLSPNASATLFRRCLQSMIKAKFKVKKGSLANQITSIKGKISDDLYGAIDNIRELGNIGAHMKKDANKIINIEPGEPNILKEAVELLFEQWWLKPSNEKEIVKKLNELAKTKKC